MRKIESYMVGLAWIALVLSIVEIIMQGYGDYVLYCLFHDFVKFNLPNWPYYIFPLAIIWATLYKKYIYLGLVIFFVPIVIRSQVRYLHNMWLHPHAITFDYMIILAVIVCAMTLCALFSGVLAIVNWQDR